VQARFTTWLSALLLLFNAALTVPSARVTPNGVSSRVVYSWQRKQKKPQSNQAEQIPNPPAPARVRAALTPAAPSRDRAAFPLLDSSLFQRPPPALS
jgi:hypothetical protein